MGTVRVGTYMFLFFYLFFYEVGTYMFGLLFWNALQILKCKIEIYRIYTNDLRHLLRKFKFRLIINLYIYKAYKKIKNKNPEKKKKTKQ